MWTLNQLTPVTKKPKCTASTTQYYCVSQSVRSKVATPSMNATWRIFTHHLTQSGSMLRTKATIFHTNPMPGIQASHKIQKQVEEKTGNQSHSELNKFGVWWKMHCITWETSQVLLCCLEAINSKFILLPAHSRYQYLNKKTLEWISKETSEVITIKCCEHVQKWPYYTPVLRHYRYHELCTWNAAGVNPVCIFANITRYSTKWI